ncbi:hypothetical protein [Chitinimonas lacunae]|uniref:PilZ domain-containing protein n=1 Tax=Chitinimonas lacunae TaxID=1963018 RepID=A0ABV8MQZ2_9NEIS
MFKSHQPTQELVQPRATRYPAHWRVAVLLDEERVIEARSVNISRTGIALHCQQTLPGNFHGWLYIEIPPRFPLSAGGVRQIVQTRAQIIYTVHDSKAQCFRSGMQFSAFIGDAEKILARELEQHFSGYRDRSA